MVGDMGIVGTGDAAPHVVGDMGIVGTGPNEEDAVVLFLGETLYSDYSCIHFCLV